MKLARTNIHVKTTIVVLTLVASVFILLVAAFLSPSPSSRPVPSNQVNFSTTSLGTALTEDRAREAYGKIEMSFEANHGQTDGSVNYLARGAGYTIFLKPTEAVFQLRNANQQTAISKQQSAGEDSGISNRQLPTQHSVLRTRIIRSCE